MKKSQRCKQVQTSQDQGLSLFDRSCPLKIGLSVSKGKSPWIMNLANSDKPGPETITAPNQSDTEITQSLQGNLTSVSFALIRWGSCGIITTSLSLSLCPSDSKVEWCQMGNFVVWTLIRTHVGVKSNRQNVEHTVFPVIN